MNSKQKSIWNFISAALSQVITIAFGIILPRLYMVNFGSEGNGLLTSLTQLLVYLNLFEAGVGAATLQALYKPVAQQDWGGISGILSATNRYYKRTGRWYLGALVALSLVYPFFAKSSLPYLTVCGAAFFSGIGNVVLFFFQGKYTFLLQAEGKQYVVSNLTTIVSTSTSLAKVLLISLGANIVAVVAAGFVIQLIQMAYILWYIRKKYPQLKLSVEPNVQAIAQRNYALIHQVSGLVFNNTDVIILTVFCGLKVVSVYSVFKLITSHIESLLTTVSGSVNFILGQTFQMDKQMYIRRHDLFESFFSAVSYALFSVTLFLFLPFMRLYTAGISDANYIDEALAILFVTASLLSMSRTCTCMTVNIAGHFKQTASRSILESAINLVVSLVAVLKIGIYGVLIGTIAALAYRTNDFIIYANKKLMGRSPWRTYSIYAVNIVLLFLTQALFKSILHTEIGSYLTFAAVGLEATALSLVTFLGGQLLFPHVRAGLKVGLAALRK